MCYSNETWNFSEKDKGIEKKSNKNDIRKKKVERNMKAENQLRIKMLNKVNFLVYVKYVYETNIQVNKLLFTLEISTFIKS